MLQNRVFITLFVGRRPMATGWYPARGLLTRASLRRLPIGAQVDNLTPLVFSFGEENRISSILVSGLCFDGFVLGKRGPVSPDFPRPRWPFAAVGQLAASHSLNHPLQPGVVFGRRLGAIQAG